jgi:hypothetical protein
VCRDIDVDAGNGRAKREVFLERPLHFRIILRIRLHRPRQSLMRQDDDDVDRVTQFFHARDRFGHGIGELQRADF